MNAYAGSFCHTGFSDIAERLMTAPLYWAVPIGCIIVASKAGTGVVICRAATWASVVGWILCFFVGY